MATGVSWYDKDADLKPNQKTPIFGIQVIILYLDFGETLISRVSWELQSHFYILFISVSKVYSITHLIDAFPQLLFLCIIPSSETYGWS